MYSDKRSNKRPLILIVILLIIISLMVLFLVFKDSGKDLSDESAMAIRDAVRKEALQCYVVEGVYPPDLDYLENNYGLKINREDFYVTYDTFASNLPPDVIVTPKITRSEAGDMD